MAEDTILMASTENFQVVGAKHETIVNIFLNNKIRIYISKKKKEKQLRKYHRDAIVKIESDNLCERYVHTRQDCLVHNSR